MKATVLVFALALAACSGGSGTGKLNLSTHVTAAAVAGATAAPTAALAIGDRVALDRARFLIRKVALETDGSGTDDGGNGATLTATTASAESASDDPADGAGDVVVRAGPLVIDLSGTQLEGGVALVFDQSVPAGTYDDLEFQIHKLTPGQSVTDTDFLPLGKSIILDLTVDGTPFQFTSDLTAVSESSGPIVVPEGGTTNVTVTVDPSGWFTGPDGFLDPRVETNRSQIEQNIRSSIRGFEDEDRDGEPDPT
ncbi:MAG TPA: hypothetical protein VLT61_04020 [Anaeromyxobacteraceae bacterium]|nr:hypothetical protein [Anaeromyxobacteraceae bacterium]